MLQKSNKLNIFYKISFVLFLTALLTMIVGLILIGTVKEGFGTLHFIGVGGVLQLQNSHFLKFSNLGQLKFGTVLATIITPILFGLNILLYLYNYHCKKQK